MRTKSQLVGDKNFWWVRGSRLLPEPFPGPWPTRWRLLVYDKEQVYLNYFGKPAPFLIHKVMRLAAHVHGEMVLADCDKGGAFRVCVRSLPYNTLPVTQYNVTLQHCYYPWGNTGSFFSPWPCWTKKIITRKGRTLFFYSPHHKLIGNPVLEENLREYLVWRREVFRKSKKSVK